MLKAFRGGNLGLFNNAASSWNHAFFWKCLSASGGGRPEEDLLVQIEKDFGTFETFKETFESAAQVRERHRNKQWDQDRASEHE